MNFILITSNDVDTPKQLWPVSANETLGDAIEEALYALWELTPSRRTWGEELSKDGYTHFDYGGCDVAVVSIGKDFTIDVCFC